MHSKARFPNQMFGASLRPEGAALAILLMLLFLLFTLLFLTLTVQPAQAQSSTPAHNGVPPTAREAAMLPQFASRLHPSTSQAARKLALAHRRSPSPQDGVIYENGPPNGTTDAWTINFGYIVSDSFVVGSGGKVGSFDIWVWEFPGDVMTAVDWSVTSAPNGGTVYGSGTASGQNLNDQFISSNQWGYDIDEISVSGLDVSRNISGTVYLNLQNAVVPSGDPVYWDENSGVGCHSQGCPSQAYESVAGTIPSEAFDINGSGGIAATAAGTPENSK